jgi:DNA ligase-associated metallophosphoesterase
MKIELCKELLTLSAEKALFWDQERILILSDVHLGKAESFQAAGIPLPSGDHLEEFKRLEALVLAHSPRQVYILGDLIHQKDSWSAMLFKDLQTFFRKHEDTQWHLLIGNHEKGSKKFLEDLHLRLHEEDLEHGPFVFTHGHKQHESSLFEIRGHLHPRIHLQQGPLRLNLPCFWVEKNRLTLPSFGLLTGGYKIKRSPRDRVYAVGTHEVFEIP